MAWPQHDVLPLPSGVAVLRRRQPFLDLRRLLVVLAPPYLKVPGAASLPLHRAEIHEESQKANPSP